MEFRYAGFDIYIDSSPDQYSACFEYSVSDGESVLTQGLEFDVDEAISSAKRWVDEFNV